MICLPASRLSEGLSSSGVKHNVRPQISRMGMGPQQKLSMGHELDMHFHLCSGMSKCLQVWWKSRSVLCDCLIIFVCSGEKAGIAG